MKTDELIQKADALVAVAQEVAARVSEVASEMGIGLGVEASLRASIAAVVFAINAYLELNAAADTSAVARSFLPEAKTRCEKSVKQLRRRVMRSIQDLRRHTGATVTRRDEEFVRSLST